jgi:hypothetical protein
MSSQVSSQIAFLFFKYLQGKVLEAYRLELRAGNQSSPTSKGIDVKSGMKGSRKNLKSNWPPRYGFKPLETSEDRQRGGRRLVLRFG